jgi:hypothetical protein
MSSSDDQSLASLLTLKQRHDLSKLIAKATEQMRTSIMRGLGSKSSTPQRKSTDTPNEQQPASQNEASSDHTNLSSIEFYKLQSAALAFFDTWRDKVLHRVNEVLASEIQQSKSKDPSHAKNVANAASDEETPSSASENAANSALSTLYPQIPTPLEN